MARGASPSPSESSSSSSSSSSSAGSPVAGQKKGIPSPYEPPAGWARIEIADNEELADFDWDTVEEDDELELVCVRIPEHIKLKSLSDLTLRLPSKAPKKPTRVGQVSAKAGEYDVVLLPGAEAGTANEDDAVENEFGLDEQAVQGAAEVRGMSMLVPRRKEGGLRIASKPFTHMLSFNSSFSLSTRPVPLPPTLPAFGAPKREQPADKLKWRFRPAGFDTRAPEGMEMPVEKTEGKEKRKEKEKEKESKEERKERKRKAKEEAAEAEGGKKKKRREA